MEQIIKKPILADFKELAEKHILRKEDIKRLQRNLKKKNHIIYVVKGNNKVIGYIHARYLKNIGYIENIVISKNFQRKGVSLRLYKKVINIIKRKSIKKIRLYPYTSKKRAINFWKKLDFQKVLSTKDMYGKKLILMEKELK